MDFGSLVGSSLLTRLLFVAALAIVFGDLLATLFAIIYQRYYYERVMRPRFGNTYEPRCSIVVPCKGTPKDLQSNLQGFLDLDYPRYEVIFVVESEKDKAVPVIRDVIGDSQSAKLAIAGLATSCAQKNHNLLAALQQTDNADVYVFADSDICPDKGWLRELVLPLGDPEVTVTSGFRWLHAKRGNAGELTHSYVNVFIYVLFVAACAIGGVGLWGGSMAIRRRDFEELGVARKWSKAAVDDMSLSQIVMKNSRKAVVVPPCITHTDDLLQTVRGTVTWFERQIMFLKNYQRSIWLFGLIPIVLAALALLLLLPISLIGAMSSERTFLGLGGGAAVVFYLGELITVTLYPLLGSMPRFHRFLMFQPIMRLTHVVSVLKTCSTNTITWAGIKYHLTFRGDVARVERPEEYL